MDDGQALLAAIREFPDEDTPRLAYADWLEEHGQAERAEFIRLQIELARAVAEPGWAPTSEQIVVAGKRLGGIEELRLLFELNNYDREATVRRLRDRERELLTHPDVAVATTVVATGHTSREPDGIRRGFVEAITCSGACWLANAAKILAAHPIRKVTLRTWPELEWRLDEDRQTHWVRFLGGSGIAPLRVTRREVLDAIGIASLCEGVARTLLARDFPGVEFVHPAVSSESAAWGWFIPTSALST